MSNKEKYTLIDLTNLSSNKVVCLTLDVEQDYGDLLDEPNYEGLQHIPELVSFFEERGIALTCFVQGSLLKTHPAEIKQLSALDVEFELHAYSHSGPQERNAEFEIKTGKEAYRRFFREDPIGYRAPLGVINRKDYEILVWHGFKFDSSVFPSLRPGTFNNLTNPTKPYLLNSLKIVEFPITVFSDVIRVPIALSYIRLMGKPYFWLLRTFKLPNLVIFVFHLHDVFGLSSYNKIPLGKFPPVYRWVFNRIYQQRKSDGLTILDEVITLFYQKGYIFSKLIDIYNAAVDVEGSKSFAQGYDG